jgi:cytochrome b561
MILRFIWLMISGRPALPASTPYWEKALARIVQYGFYLLLIAMPLSGWIMSTAADKAPHFFGLFVLPFPGIVPNQALAETLAKVHEILAYILITFILLHVAGALKHYFIDRDGVLGTMWGKDP